LLICNSLCHDYYRQSAQIRVNEEAIIKIIKKFLLSLEASILLASVYFFWFPSAFPAPSAASGVEQAEWLWLIGLFIPIWIGFFAVQGDIRIPSLTKAPWLLIIPATYILLFFSIFSDGQISTAVDRADYIPLLALIIPIMILRLVAYRRLWTFTPLDIFSVVFILLCLLSTEYAPYPSRGWQMLARPLLGMALVAHLVERARKNPDANDAKQTTNLDGGLWMMAGLGVLIGAMALFSTQWTTKSADFRWLIDRLPHVDFFYAVGGFNPNEIAGAIAWLVPLLGGLMFYQPSRHIWWQSRLRPTPIDLYRWGWRLLTGGAFFLLLLALMLGQSRAAIIGVIGALFGVAWFAVPTRRWRFIAVAGVGLLALLQAAVLFNFLPAIGQPSPEAAVGLSPRDERTSNQRFAIWDSALAIVQDHPFTGAGMNSFRSGRVRDDYPVEKFPNLFVPHAHNEFVQAAADLGAPGFYTFIGWNLAVAYMLWIGWRRSDQQGRVVVIAITGGLLAHAAYGMFDAVPLWDRFSFVYWLMLGLAAAQYQSVRKM
jgi:hypothetical protein